VLKREGNRKKRTIGYPGSRGEFNRSEKKRKKV
jgi:hypothetical protein